MVVMGRDGNIEKEFTFNTMNIGDWGTWGLTSRCPQSQSTTVPCMCNINQGPTIMTEPEDYDASLATEDT